MCSHCQIQRLPNSTSDTTSPIVYAYWPWQNYWRKGQVQGSLYLYGSLLTSYPNTLSTRTRASCALPLRVPHPVYRDEGRERFLRRVGFFASRVSHVNLPRCPFFMFYGVRQLDAALPFAFVFRVCASRCHPEPGRGFRRAVVRPACCRQGPPLPFAFAGAPSFALFAKGGVFVFSSSSQSLQLRLCFRLSIGGIREAFVGVLLVYLRNEGLRPLALTQEASRLPSRAVTHSLQHVPLKNRKVLSFADHCSLTTFILLSLSTLNYQLSAHSSPAPFLAFSLATRHWPLITRI